MAFLHDGELVETGPPEQLFEDPTDARTAQFLNGELLVGDREGSRVPQPPTADP